MGRNRRAALLLAGIVCMAGCQPVADLSMPMAPPSAAPLPQVRIQMRDVDEQGRAGTTRLTDENGQPLAVLEPAFITTADVESVALDVDLHRGAPVLTLTMKDASASRIHAATEARVGRRVAFSVGDRVLSVATIQGPFGKGMQVSGLVDPDQAQRMYTEITGKTP